MHVMEKVLPELLAFTKNVQVGVPIPDVHHCHAQEPCPSKKAKQTCSRQNNTKTSYLEQVTFSQVLERLGQLLAYSVNVDQPRHVYPVHRHGVTSRRFDGRF